MEKRYVTYKEYGDLLNILITKIKNSKLAKQIKCVYGIPRGGLGIALHLSHSLKVPLENNIPTTTFALIVDDVSDKGKTLKQVVSKYSRISKGPHYTATLFYKKHSSFRPDFFAKETGRNWIVFPWELKD